MLVLAPFITNPSMMASCVVWVSVPATRRAAGTGLAFAAAHLAASRKLAAGAPPPTPLRAVEPSVNMTDACYTNPAEASCASFQRTDAGGCWAPQARAAGLVGRPTAARTIGASFRPLPLLPEHPHGW